MKLVTTKAYMRNALNDSDGGWHSSIIPDHLLYSVCCLQVLWKRHSMTDDGAFQGNHRLAVSQSRLNLTAQYKSLKVRN